MRTTHRCKNFSELHHTSDAAFFCRGVIHFKTIYAYRKRTSLCEYATASIKNTNLKKRRHGTRRAHFLFLLEEVFEFVHEKFLMLLRLLRLTSKTDKVHALKLNVLAPQKYKCCVGGDVVANSLLPLNNNNS